MPVDPKDVAEVQGTPKLSEEQVQEVEAANAPSQAKTPLVKDQSEPVGDEATTGPAQEPVHRVSPPAADPEALKADPEGDGKVHPDEEDKDPIDPNAVPEQDALPDVELSDADYLTLSQVLIQAFEQQTSKSYVDGAGRTWVARWEIWNNNAVVAVVVTRGVEGSHGFYEYKTLLSTTLFSLEAEEAKEGEEPNDDPVLGTIAAISDSIK